MPEKDSEDSFYYLNAYQDDITPGQKMSILHNISFNDWRAGPHIAPLVTLTREEVTQRKEASITLEKELYAQLKKLAAAWDEQAAQTMLLERALEYLQTPEVEHTSNEWKQDKNGIWRSATAPIKCDIKSPMKRPPMFTSSAGESSTTHLNSQTATTGIIGETVSMSRGRIRKNTPAWRPHSIISKAGLTCIVTCSEKSPHQSPMSADGCSVSTAIWRQGTRWLHQIRKNPTRRPLMTCWPVWMTRMPQYLQRRSRKCIFLKRRLNAKSPFQ